MIPPVGEFSLEHLAGWGNSVDNSQKQPRFGGCQAIVNPCYRSGASGSGEAFPALRSVRRKSHSLLKNFNRAGAAVRTSFAFFTGGRNWKR